MEFLYLPDRFWKKVNKNGPVPRHHPDLGPCWLWIGRCDQNGYANRTTIDNDKDSPHRFAYRAFIGPIPPQLELDHLCCVRNCVNPYHLEAVTHALNQKRMGELQTHCKWGHPLSGSNLYINPKTEQRHCKTCNRERQRKFHATRRAAGAAPPEDARCKRGHPYDVDASGRWFCRECGRTRAREWKRCQKAREQGGETPPVDSR